MDKERLSWMPLAYIEERIDELQKLDLKDLEIDYVASLFRDLFRVYVSCPITISGGKSIFRARKHEESARDCFLQNLSNIYPDPQVITRLGRANRIGRPIYYFSSDDVTALRESRVEVGDVFTVIECETNSDYNNLLTPLGIHEMAHRLDIEIGGNLPDPNTRLRSLFGGDPACMHKHDLIDRFIKDEFLKIVPQGEEHLYKRTIAIAESAYAFATSMDKPIDGIAYPSIASIDGSVNVAILPESFARLCRPIACNRVVISDTTLPRMGLGLSELTPAKRILEDGTIEW